MNDLIQRIVNAIIRQEGMPADYANPGNLRAAPWLKNPAVFDGFWHPKRRAEGLAGMAHVVALHIAEGDSLSQLITHWAPPVENATDVYIANVQQWAEIPHVDVPLLNFIVE